MEESWIDIDHRTTKGRVIVAVFNKGRIKLSNGNIEESKYLTRVNGERIYRFIAKNFLTTVRRPEQIYIDHITHNPVNMNLNDVRNLRWCTIKENNNFDECCKKKSQSKKGISSWNKGMSGADYTKHYKNGIKNQFTCAKEG